MWSTEERERTRKEESDGAAVGWAGEFVRLSDDAQLRYLARLRKILASLTHQSLGETAGLGSTLFLN